MITPQPIQPVTPITPPTPTTPSEQPIVAPIEPVIQKKSPLVAILLTLLILTTTATAYFYSQSHQSVPTAQPQPTTSATASADPTADWETFTNNELTFLYPPEWKIGQGGTVLVSDVAGAGITIFTKDMAMYNECMKLTDSRIENGLMVKYYSYAIGAEACSNQANKDNKQVWITQSGGDGFQPGIIYDYVPTIHPNSENIFTQILQTFQFTN